MTMDRYRLTWDPSTVNIPLSCYGVPSFMDENLQPELRTQAVNCASDSRFVASGKHTGSSAHTRKWQPPSSPLTRTAIYRHHVPQPAWWCYAGSAATAGQGTLKISSLLYCDNCTLIGTGLEMTRPAYRLHIVSHELLSLIHI